MKKIDFYGDFLWEIEHGIVPECPFLVHCDNFRNIASSHRRCYNYLPGRKTAKEYKEHLAKEKGFKSGAEYQRYRYYVRKALRRNS